MVEIRLKTKNSSCEFSLDFNEVKIPDDINILKDLEKEIENSIYHLKRSNDEIKEFDPHGLDDDLFLALNENKFALSRKEERLKLIKKKIQNLESLNILDEVNAFSDTLTNKNKKLGIGSLIENEYSIDENNELNNNELNNDELNNDELNKDELNNDGLNNDELNNDELNNNELNNNFSSTVKNESETNFQKNSNTYDENGIYL